MALSESILSFGLKADNLYISAFTGRILCGFVKNNLFVENVTLIINHFQIVNFYTTLIKLLNCTANGPYPSEKIVCAENTSCWRVNSQHEVMLLFKESQIIFSIESLYHFIDSFSRLIFLILPVKQSEMFLLENTANLTISEIIQLKEPLVSAPYIQSVKSKTWIGDLEEYKCCHLLVHYCDLILIYKKLRSICNIPLLEKNIELVLQAT